MVKNIFITGGAGYIGSHVAEAFLKSEEGTALRKEYQLIILDNLSTGHAEFVEVLKALAPKSEIYQLFFEKVDLLDFETLNALFLKYRPEAVLHFAAKISVAESVEKPELYHRNNVVGSETLLACMKANGCKKIVFSSTAAVYGMPVSDQALDEHAPLKPINPYGENKLKMERAIQAAGLEWGLNSVIFRYFNASGASSTGLLGEWHEPETHLIPLLLESAIQGNALKVFGTDYATRDGSCIRDYIHVSDLAMAHLLGLQKLLADSADEALVRIYNLGTQTGTTVLEVIQAAESICKKKVHYQVHPRRPGDAAVLVAGNQKAKKELGFEPEHSSIENILRTALAWHQKEHPDS